MIFHKTPLVIPVLKLKLKNITFVLTHIVENSAFRLPTPILTSGYPTIHKIETCLVCVNNFLTASYLKAVL